MASQPVNGREDITSLEVHSYVRGYHVYQEIWDPRIGKVLPLEREPDNSEDKFAVAIVRRSHTHWINVASSPGPAQLSVSSSCTGSNGKVGGTWERG